MVLGGVRSAVCACACVVALAAVASHAETNVDAHWERASSRVQNVVYIMFENRAFDHIMGYLNRFNPAIDGLKGTEFNYMNAADPSSQKVFVSEASPYVDPDPNHGIPGTFEQMFGNTEDRIINPPPMDGFVQNMQKEHPGRAASVMQCFNHSSVPIISTLGLEFAVFDRWYASVPGPTFPNRLYAMSATSHGYGDNSILQSALGWPQRSLFAALEDAKVSWRVYAQEIASALLLRDTRTPAMLRSFRPYEALLSDAEAGKLPQFSWVDLRYFSYFGMTGTDQHPSHSVAAGEAVMKQVYEALRASPQWNSTLLIISYEHGGFYDHAPNPDGLNWTKAPTPFGFDRLGIRVPTVLISPWIRKGTVVHEPASSHFDHSSLSATLHKLFGIPGSLTRRDAWAATFEGVFSDPSVEQPRTDCPTKLPPVPSVSAEEATANMALPVNDLQEDFLSVAMGMHGLPYSKGLFSSQGEAGAFIHTLYQDFLASRRA